MFDVSVAAPLTKKRWLSSSAPPMEAVSYSKPEEISCASGANPASGNAKRPPSPFAGLRGTVLEVRSGAAPPAGRGDAGEEAAKGDAAADVAVVKLLGREGELELPVGELVKADDKSRLLHSDVVHLRRDLPLQARGGEAGAETGLYDFAGRGGRRAEAWGGGTLFVADEANSERAVPRGGSSAW